MDINWGPQEQIAYGPTKYELMLGLFSRTPVTFRSTGADLRVTVNSVAAEDGSAESWIIGGIINDESGRRFYAYWHTGRRQGHLKLEQRVRVTA